MTEPVATPPRRRRLVLFAVALLVVALPVGGFVAYGAYTRSGDVVYDRGGAVFGADAAPLPSVVPSPLPTGTPVPALTSDGTSAGPKQRREKKAAPAASPAANTGTKVRSAATAQQAPAGRTQPVPGTYGLRVSGAEKVTFGPFSFCGRDLPAESALVVAPATGEPEGSYNFDVRYFPGEAGKHDERHIYRYAGGAVDRTFESATVTCSGVRQGSDISFSPAQRCVIAPLKVGATWSGTGGDADRTEKYTSTVTGSETVEVAGYRVPVFVIDTRTTFSGSESGERTRRWWYAPSLAMPVKWMDTTSGGRSGAKYSNEITVTVSRLPDAAAEVLEAGGR
jgi:hypothetical protein